MGRRKKSETAQPLKEEASRDRIITVKVPEEFSWFFSGKAMEHLMAAKKEVLLAMKCMIEHKLETMEKRAKKPGKVKALRIEVE
jgi:hypothetical protein